MTSLAFCWSWLVEEHQRSIHRFLEGVAGRAGNILVSAFERESRLLVIEERRAPLVACCGKRHSRWPSLRTGPNGDFRGIGRIPWEHS